LSRQPDDEFWAAKIVMSFTDEDIRAIVETGCFRNPKVTDYITATLGDRQNKIGRTYFSKVLPLDGFRIQNDELQFDDLAVKYGFRAPTQYMFRWFSLDNITQQYKTVTSSTSARLPDEFAQGSAEMYFSAVIYAPADEQKCVTVTLRKTANGYEVLASNAPGEVSFYSQAGVSLIANFCAAKRFPPRGLSESRLPDGLGIQ
jgi:hypothetical protein